MKSKNEVRAVKGSFIGAAAFYVLIAFEFLYMASPFAIYFYSVYEPALDFFNQSKQLAWLIRFFMPHFTHTSSTIINLHNIIGGKLALFGFIAFCVGVVQVYSAKLFRKGAVTGGVYNIIRHPQYASFIICSFGLFLLWPRFIVLLMFVTMLFAYYMLARAEEKECELKFGKSYTDYMAKTNMFLPFKLPWIKGIPRLPKSKIMKIFAMLGIYVIALTISMGIAVTINNWTLQNLYGEYTDDSATISINRISSDKLQRIIEIALSDENVKKQIDLSKVSENTKFLNYVLPTEGFIAEVPMTGISTRGRHDSMSDYDGYLYKIIITKADMRADVTGRDIIQNVITRNPVVEVWVDLEEGIVTDVYEMSDQDKYYADIPVAFY